MKKPSNVVPLQRNPVEEEDEESLEVPPHVLGVLHRKDFELWIAQSGPGRVSLKWWGWRDEIERFLPLEEGELTVKVTDLEPLAELLHSVATRLDQA